MTDGTAPADAPQDAASKPRRSGRKAAGLPAGKAPTAPPVSVGKATATAVAVIHPGRVSPISDEVQADIGELESLLGMPVALLVQSGRTPWDIIDGDVPDGFEANIDLLPEAGGIALLVDSPGGLAGDAYRLANLLRKRCGSFVALVPRYAKSAATLVCLGAERIIMGDFAELGPLDVQLFDPDREDRISALDEVQALAQLTEGSLESVDTLMTMLIARSGKRTDSLLPHAMRFVAETTRPLYEKIDTVHYTQTARLLRLAEQYAVRLLRPYYPTPVARRIAAHLIEHYPAHEFIIDRDEAQEEGLRAEAPSPEMNKVFQSLIPKLRQGLTLIGPIRRV